MNMLDLFSRTERIENIIHKIQQLVNEVLYRDLFLLAQIQQLAVQAVADRAPLVLEDQSPMIDAEAEVTVDEKMKFCDECLKECGDRDRIINASWNVANTKFECWELVMRPDIPPDLGAVLNTVHLYKQINIALILCVRFKMIRDLGARELLKDLGTIRFEAGIVA